MTLGFDRQLYMPFDHRGNFQTKMLGWDGTLTAAQTAEIAAAKQVIYDGWIGDFWRQRSGTAAMTRRGRSA
jgi:5-dehydro-2-deoxygluconokinase